MPEPRTPSALNRRHLITGAGAMIALGLAEADALAQARRERKLLTPEQQSALEAANEKLVTDFINDYATRDIDKLAAYLADDIIYQVSEGQPEIHGLDAYRRRNGPMLEGLEKVDWQILRSFAIGQLVINDRIDEFYPKPGGRVPRMRFRVAGYFLVVDGKIQIWRDFGYPGARQLIQPAPKA